MIEPFCLPLIFLLCLTPATQVGRTNSGTVVKIKDGLIRGNIYQTVDQNNTYYAFKAIPYAEPPIGDLRFEPPVPIKSWSGIKDATEEAEMCMQNGGTDYGPSGTEDCLFVNVYTPKLAKNYSTEFAVMVWFYGGGFQFGKAPYSDSAPDYLLDQNVIFVSFQYRLGIFGFLSTEDLVVPGNTGLKDQILALKWVQENIGFFNGDPGRVTLIGQSAGAVSISYLTQSKLAEGLFHQTILQSGTSLCIWTFSRYPKKFAVKIADKLNLTNIQPHDSKTLVEQLKRIDASLLQWASVSLTLVYLFHDLNNGLYFAPVIEPDHEGAVITNKSHEQLLNGDFIKVPSIIGYNSQEGISMSLGLVYYLASLYELDISRLPPADLNIQDRNTSREVGEKIHEFYWNNSTILTAPQINTVQYISDHEFNRPIRESVKLVSKQSRVYFYKFYYEGLLGGSDSPLPGVAHGEELNYVFRSSNNSTETDRLVRSKVVTLWTNFAKYGNPTPHVDPLLDDVIWPFICQSGDRNLFFLNISDGLLVGKDESDDHMAFWDYVYKQYGQPPFDTY